MKKSKGLTTGTYNNLLERVAEILNQARGKVIREINKAQVLAYWEIGREIVEFEQKGKERAEYGKKTIVKLSEDLTARFGRGFSVDNLELMRKFYLVYPDKFQISETSSGKSIIHQRLSDKFESMLSWSHYCELLKVEEPLARSFYEQESIQNNWSVRGLKRQIGSMLFERLALSKDTKAVMKDNEKTEGENDPIGLILCAKKDDIFAKYVLGGLSNKVFASKYKLALPSEKELREKLRSLPLLDGKKKHGT